ncbi:MAG: oligosaccharide flippase family protein [Gemmatimonadaceae bacterium]
MVTPDTGFGTTAPELSSEANAARHAVHGSVLGNASALFIGQAVGLVVPLLVVPYLARVLGPAGWGPVLAAQGLANWLILIFEFGFDLSGTRAVARARATLGAMSQVVHAVQSAKLLLVAATVPLVAVILFAIPSVRSRPALFAWAVAFAVLRGLSPLWFYQGIERVRRAVAVDAVGRAAAALGVFFLVHGPSDGWRVIALQAALSAVTLVALTVWLGYHVGFQRPRTSDGLATLRENWSLFACRVSSGLYIQANTLVLSALASPVIVAFFGGAERIIRAAINLLQPLTQAFLPRLSFLRAADEASATRMIRFALAGVGLVGASMGAVAFFGSHLLVRTLLGPGYESAVPVLRTLAALPPLVAVNTVLGMYWAVPFGHERVFLKTIIAAGFANLVLAVSLVPHWGASGMAVAAISAEVVVLGMLGTAYIRRST